MMKKIPHLFAAAMLLLSVVPSLSAQMRHEEGGYSWEMVCDISELLPEDVVVKGPCQGIAMHGDYLFSFHNGGQVVILDIKKKEFVNTFQLEGNKTHCNSARFGTEKYSKDSQFPLLYISECGGGNCCFVTDITLEGSRIVQKIYYTDDDSCRFADWSVDAKHGCIYLYGSAKGIEKVYRKYPLPSLSDSDANGEVHLSKKDLLAEYLLKDILIAQGNHTDGRYAWFTDGGGFWYPRKLHKFDLKTGEMARTYDISGISFEPEDIEFKGKDIYLQDYTGDGPRRAIIYRIRVDK